MQPPTDTMFMGGCISFFPKTNLQEVIKLIFKPSNIVPSNVTLSLADSNTISWKNNGDIMEKFTIIIIDNATQAVVHNSSSVVSSKPSYVLPANTIKTAMECKIQIVVFNASGESAVSDYIVARFYNRPVVNVPNDGYMRNQKMYISAEYSHVDNHAPKAYIASLFNEYGKLLERTDYIYSNSTTIEHEFNYMLEDDVTYQIEVMFVTQYDLSGTSGKINMIADYEKSVLNLGLITRTELEKPYVELEWSTVRIVGHGVNYTVVDNVLNVMDGIVYFDENFSVDGDFAFTVCFMQVENDIDLIELTGGSTSLKLSYYGNRFHLVKIINGKMLSHYATEELLDYTGGQICVSVSQQGRMINLTNNLGGVTNGL